MRIVAGKHKGRPITAPAGHKTRPTSDRARESVFNILMHADWAPGLADARIIDLFAGSGALGLEAISRGAGFCLFVDTDNAARGAIRKNIEAMSLFGVTRIHRRSATALGPRPAAIGAPFDIAFMDPPYHKGLVPPALEALTMGDWLIKDAIVMIETASEERLDLDGWEMLDEREKGAAKIVFVKKI